MSGFAVAIFVPAVLFMIFVAPIWVIMHYRSLNRSSSVLNEDDRSVLEDMLATQDKLAERIVSLEAILDVDHPNWRQHGRVRGVNNG
jgi:phage shock protein B